MTLEDCRRYYADEIRLVAGLCSPPLVEAFARVPREKFLGRGPWKIALAEQLGLAGAGSSAPAYVTTDDPRDLYHNVLVALDATRGLNNGQPSTLAHWIQALDLRAGDRVYHLGCGAGYYTAIMAEIVGAGGSVVASEVDASLAERARENLAGYRNVTVQAGDGAAFDPGICDAMLINAGVTHPHRPWLERLGEGGRVVLPLTFTTREATGTGIMVKIVRERSGFSASIVSTVGIYSCTSARDPELEPLLKKALATGSFLQIKSARLEAHEQTESCVLHRSDVCLSTV